MWGSQGNAKKFHLGDVRRLIRCRSNVELVGVLAVGENPSSCRGGSSPPHSCSAHLSFFSPQSALGSSEVLSCNRDGRRWSEPPVQNLHLRAKVTTWEMQKKKYSNCYYLGLFYFRGFCCLFFFDSTVPPVEPVSERHPSLSHTSPNHHSPHLVGINFTKRLHSKQKLGLVKIFVKFAFFWCCFWACRHLTSMMKLFKIDRPPIEPVSETHPPANHPPTPPRLLVGRKPPYKTSTLISKVTTWET